MYYRSDWPEAGLPSAFVRTPPAWSQPSEHCQVVTARRAANEQQWVATKSQIESDLYAMPMWSLHVELAASAPAEEELGPALKGAFGTPESLSRLVNEPGAYVCSKVVMGGAMHQLLEDAGFTEVERRRVFLTPAAELVTAPLASEVKLCSLGDLDEATLSNVRSQLLELCREAYTAGGHSRHFQDPLLVTRQTGLSYMLAMMELNLKNVPPSQILLALAGEQVLGFTVLTRKGIGTGTYSQLLSIVRQTARGKGIYQALSHHVKAVLAHEGDVLLMNVTHAHNQAMLRAFARTGRRHLADTVVLRRQL